MTMFCASAFKSTKQTPIGINLWAAPDAYRSIIIVAVDDHGLFSNKLKVGMQVDRINNLHCCGLSIPQIELHLNEISGRITILASTPNLSKSSYLDSMEESSDDDSLSCSSDEEEDDDTPNRFKSSYLDRMEEFSDDDSLSYSSDEEEDDDFDKENRLLQARPSDHVFQIIMNAPTALGTMFLIHCMDK